jgi:hypothetical protein
MALECSVKEAGEFWSEAQVNEGGKGVFIPLPPKLAVIGLSSRDSEEIFGDTKQQLRRFRICAETPHIPVSKHIPQKAHVRRLRKILRKLRIFL